MRGKPFIFLIYVLMLTCGLLAARLPANAQVVHVGIKAGANYSWVRPSDKDFRKIYNTSGVLGYNAGLAFNFNIREKYFLHSEFIYSKKGKITTGPEQLKDRAIYNFIEFPLMYNISFKGQLDSKHIKQFKWYVGFGPNFSYWLGGHGNIAHYEFIEFDSPPMDYKIKFGKRPEADEGRNDIVYIQDPNRFQLGLNIGGGILLEPLNGKKFMLDVRFELGSSWYGLEDSMDRLLPQEFRDDMRMRNMGVRLSAMYMLEFNTDKKVRNRGKSTKKIRRR